LRPPFPLYGERVESSGSALFFTTRRAAAITRPLTRLGSPAARATLQFLQFSVRIFGERSWQSGFSTLSKNAQFANRGAIATENAAPFAFFAQPARKSLAG
jgi:hypothetical protein